MWPFWHARGSNAKFICRSRCRGGGTVSKNLDGIGQIHLWDLQSGLPKGSKPADAQTPPQGSCPYGCWSWRVDSSGSTGHRVVHWPIKVDASLHFEAPRWRAFVLGLMVVDVIARCRYHGSCSRRLGWPLTSACMYAPSWRACITTLHMP